MIIWDEYRWIIWLVAIVIIVILLDEWAYNGWKKANPGHMYSHLKEASPPLDPYSPPMTVYYE